MVLHHLVSCIYYKEFYGLALDQDVLRGEIVLDIDGHAAARQVADVSDARPDDVLAAQDPHERLGLGRGLHDDEGLSRGP